MQWLTRRKAHLQRAQQGIPISGISEYGVTSTVFFPLCVTLRNLKEYVKLSELGAVWLVFHMDKVVYVD